jgi:hypothetical protein
VQYVELRSFIIANINRGPILLQDHYQNGPAHFRVEFDPLWKATESALNRGDLRIISGEDNRLYLSL